MKSRPAPNLQNKNSKLVQSKKTSPKTKGVTKKVGRPKLEDQNADKGAGVGAGLKGDLAGRRVSTRSKKPGDFCLHFQENIFLLNRVQAKLIDLGVKLHDFIFTTVLELTLLS